MHFFKIIFILLFLPVFSFGQFNSIPTKDAETIYVDTIYKIDSVSKSELYSRAKIWLSDYFKSSKAVIDLDDKDNGILICKGMHEIVVLTPLKIEFTTRCYSTIRISLKDNKTRIEIYDVYYKNYSHYAGGTLIQETETYPTTWFLPKIGKRLVITCEGYRDKTLEVINGLCSSIEKGLKTSFIKSDW